MAPMFRNIAGVLLRRGAYMQRVNVDASIVSVNCVRTQVNSDRNCIRNLQQQQQQQE